MDTTHRGRPSKFAELIDRHDPQGMGEELELLWTADDPSERRSLLDLVGYFNETVFRVVLIKVSINPVDSEVKNYRLLVNDDASTADRIRSSAASNATISGWTTSAQVLSRIRLSPLISGTIMAPTTLLTTSIKLTMSVRHSSGYGIEQRAQSISCNRQDHSRLGKCFERPSMSELSVKTRFAVR